MVPWVVAVMASILTFAQNEVAILGRVIGPDRDNLPVTAARAILKLDFEPADLERMHELAAKAREGTLTAADQAEIDAYEVVGRLLGLMHSKARLSVKGRKTSA